MKRILSSLVLVPAALAVVVYASPPVMLVLVGVVGSLCLHEYFGLTRAMGLCASRWFGYGAFWVMLAGFHYRWVPATVLPAAVLMAGFLAAMWRQDPMTERARSLMATTLGVFYLALFLYPVLPLRYDFGDQQGLGWLVLLLATIWVGDTAALLVGRRFGRTLFAPALSPNKTNEGAIGGLLAGMLAAVLLQHFLFQELPLQHVAAVSFLLGMFGQLGDLAESMLKRAANIKDSSQLIPGHGGILDRIDSLLFAFPVLYLYLLMLYSR